MMNYAKTCNNERKNYVYGSLFSYVTGNETNVLQLLSKVYLKHEHPWRVKCKTANKLETCGSTFTDLFEFSICILWIKC